MRQRCTCAHGVTPVTILSLSELCVALTSAVIAARLARCQAASDSCIGAVDALQEHCTQDTTLDGGVEVQKRCDTTQTKHIRSVGIPQAVYASTRGGSNYFRGGPNISEI